jgi:hypothetical protein
MIIPNAPALAVPELREILGLPNERPVGVRDVIAIPWTGTDPMPENPAFLAPIGLPLGDWPEEWLDAPETAPKYLVTLRGPANPYRVAGIWESDPQSWSLDTDNHPRRRAVPVRALAYVASATLAGRTLDIGLTFGWLDPDEQFAFL